MGLIKKGFIDRNTLILGPLINGLLLFQLCYFFLPPNYGKNEIITHFISILERIINLIILNTQYFAKIFGNTDIIECER